MLDKIPSAERREAWLRVARKPYTAEELDQARDNLVALLDRMEGMMVDGWLIQGGFSLADIAVAPFVRRIGEEIAPDELLPENRPKVADWWARLQSRPAYVKARFDPFLSADPDPSA